MKFNRRDFGKLALTAAVTGVGNTALAQSYPAAPIKLIVGLAAGGSTDVTARLLAAKLNPIIGQSVIVENRPGAGSMIAAEAVVRSPADGYTFFVGTGSFATNAVLSTELAFDPLHDLVPIVQITRAAFCLAVHPSLGITSVEELVEKAKANPGKLKYSSSGVGGQGHFAGELFNTTAQTQMPHVPYNGAAPALTATISGEVPIAFTDIISYRSRVTKDELRLLAVTSPTRAAVAPDVPTLQERGFDRFDVVGWTILFAPKGVSADIVSSLHNAVARIAGDKEFNATLTQEGGELVFNSQPEAEKFFISQIELYRQIADKSDMRKR